MALSKTRLIILLSLVMLYSCTDEKAEHNQSEEKGNFKEFYADGVLKAVGDTVNGEHEGLYKEFYPSGKIKYINHYKQGYLDGDVKEFFENGNPKIDMFYVKGKPLGVQYVYFESDSGRLKNKFIVSRYRKKEVLASRIEFNESGDTVKDDSRVTVLIPKDTFDMNEKIPMKFSLNYPEFTNYKVHLGNFERTLELKDSLDYKVYEGEGNQVTLDIMASKKGKNVVRGYSYMEDFKIDKRNEDGSYSTIGTLNNWFDVEFYVK